MNPTLQCSEPIGDTDAIIDPTRVSFGSQFQTISFGIFSGSFYKCTAQLLAPVNCLGHEMKVVQKMFDAVSLVIAFCRMILVAMASDPFEELVFD